MLPKRQRLSNKEDIQRVFGRGARAQGVLLVVRYHKTRHGGRSAVVVGSRVERRAVGRNVIRRRIREALREIFGHTALGYDMVVIAQPSARDASFDDIRQELKQLLAAAKII